MKDKFMKECIEHIEICRKNLIWRMERKEYLTQTEKELLKSLKAHYNEPLNNDERIKCFWCHGNLKEIQGFLKIYKICLNCEK